LRWFVLYRYVEIQGAKNKKTKYLWYVQVRHVFSRRA